MSHSSGLTFRTAGDWGAGKGANLTPSEVDQNFYDVEERVDILETSPPVAVSISAINVVGSSMTIFLDDSTELGPFTLPTAAHADFQFSFGAAPANASVIDRIAVLRALTIPANFTGSFGNVETNPAAIFDMDVQDDGVSIGTISVSTDGTFTFTTTGGTEKNVAAGSVVRIVTQDALSAEESTIAGLTVGIIAALD